MASSDIQRRTFYFLVTAAVIVVVLLLFPVIEDWALAAMAARMGMAISPDGTVAMLDGSAPAKMTETSITLLLSVLHLLKIVVWMALVIAVVRYVSFLITKTVYRNAKQGEVSSLLRTVLSVIVYIVAFFIIFQSQFPSVQLAPLFTGSTIIGIVVGLALQDTLGNLFAGLALQADQPFQVGDVITLPGRGEGVVESVSWRGVKIRTFQNKLLVISNAILGKELIEVAPKGNLNAKAVFFNTLYTHSPAKTIIAVREAVRQVENVSPKMRPVVRIRNLAPDGIDWEVKYWLEDYRQQHDTDALVRQRIWYVFQREKIHFAYPTRTVYMEQKPEEPAAEEVFNTFAERLNLVSIFAPLSKDEIEQLANSSTTRVYAPGEAIVRQGQEGNSMFVILRGSVDVQIPENGSSRSLNTLGENDFFGEMSLLTGEPRTANVVAMTETEVLRIDKSGLKPIVEENPDLVQTIGELVEERRELLRQSALAEAEHEASAQRRKGMLRSIRSFFGLK